mgnify:CR=1 FL=1
MTLVTMLVQISFGKSMMLILLHLRHVYLRSVATVATNKKIKKTLDTIAFVCYSVTIINNVHGGQYMYKFANTLLTKLNALQHVEVTEREDGEGYDISVDLGNGWAGDYATADWGGWGNVSITSDDLCFETTLTEEDGEVYFWQGNVVVEYAKDSGLVYTSKLEDKLMEVLEKRTNGLLTAHGSEQGMQGENYLDVDVFTEEALAA